MTLPVQIYEWICMDDNEMPVGCPVGGGGERWNTEASNWWVLYVHIQGFISSGSLS